MTTPPTDDPLRTALRGLSLADDAVREAAFAALDRAETPADAVAAAVESLDAAPDEQAQLAHLYVLHDILANTRSACNTQTYAFRGAIEAVLPHVFETLQRGRKATRQIMRRTAFSEAVEEVLNIWSEWEVFSSDFIVNLSHRFLKD